MLSFRSVLEAVCESRLDYLDFTEHRIRVRVRVIVRVLVRFRIWVRFRLKFRVKLTFCCLDQR